MSTLMNQALSELHQPLPWFALTVKPQSDLVVRQALEMKGFEAYAPTYETVRRWSDRLKKLHRPLFTGYVFCRYFEGSRTPVLRTPGVCSVVSFGGELAAVPDSDLEPIRRALASGLPVEPWPFLEKGQPVCIASGPLAGVTGTVIESRDHWRVVVSVEMLRRSVAVHVSRSAITATRPCTSPVYQ